MGFRIAWLATKGPGKDAMLETFDLRDTGEDDEANEAPFSIAELPTGWTILWSNDEDFFAEENAAALSRVAPVILVHVNETCMHSTATGFEAGNRVWRVHHEGDEVIDHLEKMGSLPDGADTIEADLRASQTVEDAGEQSVDFLFDIPLEIAKSQCGFKHDEFAFEWGEPEFTAVESRSTPPAPTGWLSRLFGGR